MRHLFLIYFIILTSLFGISPTDLEKINQRNNMIILQDTQRQAHTKRQETSDTHLIDTDTYALSSEALVHTNCFTINQFIFHNTKILTEEDLRPIINLYQNKCLGKDHISNLLKRINNIYIKKGYITSQAYLKEQDLSSGTLQIYLFEGKLENIFYNGKKSSETLTAFPNLEEKILNLRDIEMGLDQINRLPRNEATLTLEASSKEGYSLINIINQEKRLILGNFSINSTGIETTGKGQGSSQFYIDNPFHLNSQFLFNVNGSLKQLDEKRSQGYSIDWSIPYGYFLFSAGYREFLYRSTIYGENSNYISSGESINYYSNLDYVFYRDTKLILKTNIGLELKQNLNFIANELIRTSSTKLTVGNIGIAATYTFDNSQLNANFTIHKGLKLFDPVLNTYDAYKKAQFMKYTMDLFLNTNFSMSNVPLNLTSILSTQYSNDKLYSPELISIGGLYTVRGFEYMEYFGEIGAYTHNDLTYRHTTSLFSKNINISPYIGFDMGVIEYDKNIWKYMVGSGFGLNLNYRDASLSFDFGVPIFAFDPIAEKNYTSSFSLQYQF